MSILRSYITSVLFQLLVAPIEDIKEWMEAEKKFLSPRAPEQSGAPRLRTRGPTGCCGACGAHRLLWCLWGPQSVVVLVEGVKSLYTKVDFVDFFCCC